MIKSEVIELRNKVLEKLEPFYKEHGFKLVRKLANFKNMDSVVMWGESSIHIDSLTFRPRFKVENRKIGSVLAAIFPNVIGISITIVRSQSIDLIKEVSTENFESDFLITQSDGSKSYYYSVEMDSNLDPIIQDHVNFMIDFGFPFLDKLSSLKGINDYINCRVISGDRDYFGSEGRQFELKKYFDKREVLSGVVSAYLTKNPEIDERLERYRILFEGNDYILDDVEKIVQYFIHVT
ncbi:MAG: hypothetical protein IPL46_13345 [Saprospiraceae bacterium]|nr:hypothetical protein [Saprospiraceae bacterium]